jgi:enterochelin esterase-like enzyme
VPAGAVDLLIITPQVVVVLWVVTLLVAGLALRSWRRRRRHGRLAATTLTVLLLVTSCAASVNAHYQYLPRVADVLAVPTWPTAPDTVAATGRATGVRTARAVATTTDLPGRPSARPASYPLGAVVHVALPGTTSHFGTRQAMVYLPPQYFSDASRRFPVAYLVHGSPGAPVDWFRAARAAEAGLAAARAGHPVILVAPRASRYWTDDSECVDGPHGNVQTYLAVDVPNAVDSLFRTVPGPQQRAIVGNSAGGFCALNLGLRHRATFGLLLDLSGFDRPTYSGGMAALYGRSPDLRQRVDADTPALYAAAMSAAPRVHVWLDYGRADTEARHDGLTMAVLLRGRDQDVTVHERHGGHEYGVWRPALRESLLWAAGLMAEPPPVASGK